MTFSRVKWLVALILAWGVLAQGLPEGEGKALVEQRCSVCHGLEVITGNRLSAAEWDAVVGSMIGNGAQLNDAERKVVVAYLATHFGKEAAQAAPAPADEGAKVYAMCQGCHQANGAGVPGAFPPLAKHVPAILTAPGGRAYLPLVVLGGLQGSIVVEGVAYNAPMPAFASLSDAQVAAVLNYVASSWGNAALLKDFKPYTAEEIRALRQPLTPQQVYTQRAKLGLK
ncbi:c-type cytochrome [Calidithermus roseus]|uniref:Cytochrome c-552 n=1 Tax=Calidithermus roseus TaxID=1644118 RepID=A0A399F171_9DEIN|nr:c-type cytochrome [Calidithermus roseus]RIH89416.1 Cytochrome c-552 [Calidithermus roseus]